MQRSSLEADVLSMYVCAPGRLVLNELLGSSRVGVVWR